VKDIETEPVRVQLSRKKGWRMPENTVSVARPGLMGNPFRVGEYGTPRHCVEAYRRLLSQQPSLRRHGVLRILKGMEGRGEARVAAMRDRVAELRGKNLACWCALDQPCHADVLLEIANRSDQS
jgi:hypothetical protein